MNKKGFLLIASSFLVLFLGIFLSFSLLRMSVHVQSLDLKRASLLAFYAAETGLEAAVNELRRNANWRDGYTDESLIWTQGGQTQTVGYYSVVMQNGPDFNGIPTMWLQAIGTDVERATRRIVVARVTVENPASFFASSIGNMVLGSGTTINGDVMARDLIFSPNAAFTDPNQRRITVNGDAQYINAVSGQTSADVVINGSISQHPPTTFVGVDLQRYSELATQGGRVVNGNFTYSGNINWANLNTTNGIVYVNGDLRISGTVSESIFFVATGDIYIESDIICQTVGDAKAQIGLGAHDDVFISSTAPSDLSLDAFIIADGGVFKAEGLGGTKNQLDFTGAVTVRGKASEPTSMSLNVYNFRNYNYDTSLSSNMTIPYLGYIANFLLWQEALSTDTFPPA